MFQTSPQNVAFHQLSPEQIGSHRAELEMVLWIALAASTSGQALDIRREATSAINLAERSPGYVTIVGVRATRMLATIIGLVDEGSAFVLWLAVRPEARRQGLANALVDYFETLAQAELVKGYVNLDDAAAVAFWNQRGWRRLHPPPRRILMGRCFKHGCTDEKVSVDY